jgi:hypothetical protein
MNRVNRNPTPLSPSIKFKRSKMLAIGLGALVGICALAALAIGLYFLITKNMNTTSTTSTTTGKHYSDLQSTAMKSQDFAK